MDEVVYILGAGVNQSITGLRGDKPPMSKNFFQTLLKIGRFKRQSYFDIIDYVFEYIQTHFHYSMKDLEELPFDIEELFTYIERQIEAAERDKKEDEMQQLLRIYITLKSVLAEVLNDFEYTASLSHTMRNFGRVLVHEKPTILTLNYDCIIEDVLEKAHGPSLVYPPKEYWDRPSPDAWPSDKRVASDAELSFSVNKWNRLLGYGIKFDEVEIPSSLSKYASGARFYSDSKNTLYENPILKLHGSLNWFKYLSTRARASLMFNEPEPQLEEKANHIILKRGLWWFSGFRKDGRMGHGSFPEHDGWFLDPVIITPTLYKDKYYDERPFKEIWDIAKEKISRCKKVVIIGYSLPPTDFNTKQLIRESMVNNDLEKLIVVNPNQSLVKTAKELFHFKKGVVWYSNLTEYVDSFNTLIKLEPIPKILREEDLPTDTSPHEAHTKCKTCNIEFPVGIKTNPRAFAANSIRNYSLECPNGHFNTYNDYELFLVKI